MLVAVLALAVALGAGRTEIDASLRHVFIQARLDAFDGHTPRVFATLPARTLEHITESQVEALSRRLTAVAFDQETEGTGIRGVEIMARVPGGPYRPLVDFLPQLPPPPHKPREMSRLLRGPPANAPGTTAGSLGGKTLYISQSHGFYWDVTTWRTQRGNTNDLVEDLLNAEAINQYLVPYLENAGAQVFTVRERDMGHEVVVVDDDDPAYSESGAAGRFADSGFAAFAKPPSPMDQSTAPFELGDDRLITTTSSDDAFARWVPTFPVTGFYTVYVAYTQDSARARDAHYRVIYSAGSVDIRVDQTTHGSSWVSLGRFYFTAGADAGRGAVELHNDALLGGTVSADAVRFGGGMGDIDRGGGTSGRPRWEQAARYYTQYTGAPASVYDPWTSGDQNDDVSSRSRYAAYEHPAGEDALYISWHTNAPNPGTGTSSYVYGPNPPDGSYNFTGAARSDVLATFVHNQIVADIRAAWDPNWRDRGIFSAYFGEINPSHNNEMPSCLVEVAFHDTPSDADALREPRFRALVARAITHAAIEYFADRDGLAALLPPEPPTHLVVRGVGPGSVDVSWRPPAFGTPDGDAATSYRVYRSQNGAGDGRGFALASEVTASTARVDGLGAGPVWVRVTAVNAGGESFPTETLGALPAGFPAPVLVVNGFDRIDGVSLVREDMSAWSLGTVDRMFLEHVNSFDYAIAHGNAIASLAIPFDAAANDAVATGDIDLADYAAIDWIAGEESTLDESFSIAEQTIIGAYLDKGGAMMASGAEIAWDLGWRGAVEDQTFLADYLGAIYVADDAGLYDVAGSPGTFATTVAPFVFDDGTGDTYAVDYPDVLGATGAGFPILTYTPSGDVAGLAVDGTFRTVILGFPFESILDRTARDDLMAVLLPFLLGSWTPPVTDDGGSLNDGAGQTDGGAAAGDDSVKPGDATGGGDGRVVGDAAVSMPPGGCGCAEARDPLPPMLLVLALWCIRRRRETTRHAIDARAASTPIGPPPPVAASSSR